MQRFDIIKTIPPPNSEAEPKPVTKTKDARDIPILSSCGQLITSIEQGNRPDMVLINQWWSLLNAVACIPMDYDMEKKDKGKKQRNTRRYVPSSREDLGDSMSTKLMFFSM